VRIPVFIAGGLGPDNVVDAIRIVRPAGVDSKTKTDKDDGSHGKDLEKVKQFVSRAKTKGRTHEVQRRNRRKSGLIAVRH
jgi:phosphoribosylanthranilate isomerase